MRELAEPTQIEKKETILGAMGLGDSQETEIMRKLGSELWGDLLRGYIHPYGENRLQSGVSPLHTFLLLICKSSSIVALLSYDHEPLPE